MIETEADRVALLLDEGESLAITDGVGGAPIEVDDGTGGLRLPRGVFSYEHETVDVELPVSSRRPVVLVPTAEIPGVETGWSVALSAGTFRLAEHPRSDGLGMSLLILIRPQPAAI